MSSSIPTGSSHVVAEAEGDAVVVSLLVAGGGVDDLSVMLDFFFVSYDVMVVENVDVFQLHKRVPSVRDKIFQKFSISTVPVSTRTITINVVYYRYASDNN